MTTPNDGVILDLTREEFLIILEALDSATYEAASPWHREGGYPLEPYHEDPSTASFIRKGLALLERLDKTREELRDHPSE